MATVTRRYRKVNVSSSDLPNRVNTASINVNFTNIIKIDVNDTTPADAISDLDNYMASLGFTFSAATVGVDVESHGSRHAGGAADAIANATGAVAGLVTAAQKTKLDTLGTGASTQMIFFGVQTITAVAETRFIDMIGGFDDGDTGETTDHPMPLPLGGTLQNFYVRHNAAVGILSVDYTVMINGVATALVVTVPNGAAGQVADTTHSAAVVAGDLVSVRAVKTLAIVNGALDITGCIEFRAT